MKLALVCSAKIKDAGGNDEDRLLAVDLRRRGLVPSFVAWDDPAVDWSGFAGVLIRACWDYHLRLGEFRAWLHELDAASCQVWNPTHLVRWNADKRYLLDLAGRGVPVVPSRVLDPGADATLAELFDLFATDALVVKPTVGATASGTFLVHRADAPATEARFASRLEREALLVQPFVREVTADGEWSLVVLDGRFSHAVLKRPAPGDYRVQDDWGGSSEKRAPPALLKAAAEGVLEALGEDPLYARVDLVVAGGEALLMELELIEPYLFLNSNEAGPEALGRGVERRLGRARQLPKGVTMITDKP